MWPLTGFYESRRLICIAHIVYFYSNWQKLHSNLLRLCQHDILAVERSFYNNVFGFADRNISLYWSFKTQCWLTGNTFQHDLNLVRSVILFSVMTGLKLENFNLNALKMTVFPYRLRIDFITNLAHINTQRAHTRLLAHVLAHTHMHAHTYSLSHIKTYEHSVTNII